MNIINHTLNKIADSKRIKFPDLSKRPLSRKHHKLHLDTVLSTLVVCGSLLFARPSLADASIQNKSQPLSNQNIPSQITAKTDIAISNYPLFLISEAVTQGAPSGKLLLDAGDIGHHGSLSPSDIKTVQDSRYVVWFGDALETNLTNTLNKYNNSISLYDLPAFERKPLRDVKGADIDNTLDPHIWLDPNNAKAIARALGALYSRANPQYKALYERNVANFSRQMDGAVAEVKRNLPYQASNQSLKSYWAYHDAFQYIEPSLNLTLAGTLTTDHHLPPKASQFRWLQQNRPYTTMCMVMQNDSNKAVVNKLKPLAMTVQNEDMSQNDSFVIGWKNIAMDIANCVAED